MQDLGGVKSNLDPTIFIWRTDKKLKGIMSSHVDDFFYGRDVDFEEMWWKDWRWDVRRLVLNILE